MWSWTFVSMSIYTSLVQGSEFQLERLPRVGRDATHSTHWHIMWNHQGNIIHKLIHNATHCIPWNATLFGKCNDSYFRCMFVLFLPCQKMTINRWEIITRVAPGGPDRRKWLFSEVRGGIWTPHSPVLIKISADKRPLNQLTVKKNFFFIIHQNILLLTPSYCSWKNN